MQRSHTVTLLLLLSACSSPRAEPRPARPTTAAPGSSSTALASGAPTTAPAGIPTPPATDCPEPTPCTQGCADPPRALAVGKGHACALGRDGALSCWGDNANGQLGDGTRQPRATPIVAAKGVRAVAADEGTTCIVEAAGVRCLGGLGRPLTVEPSPGENENVRTFPALSPPIRDAVSIFAGFGNACTLDAQGSATCFIAAPPGTSAGSIFFNRIAKPAPVKGATNLVEIAPGVPQSCGRTKTGGVVCWNTADDATAVDGLSNITSVAVTYSQSCASDREGAVWCWQRGIAPKRRPMAPVVEVRGGGQASLCARMRSGEVTCWGRFGDEQSIGAGGTRELPEPTTIAGAKGATQLAVGAGHACAATSDGIRCWGSTQRGALGDGQFAEKVVPVRVELPGPAVDVDAYGDTTCAALADGRVACWGHGYARDPQSPAEGVAASIVSADVKLGNVGVGEGQACALAGGKVWCWAHGPRTRAEPVEGVETAIAVAPGINGGCAARASGEMLCWWPGRTATTLPGVSGFVDFDYLASDFSCGRRRDATMACWSTPLSMPGAPWPASRLYPIPGISSAVDVSKTCAADGRGDVACIGSAADKYKARPVPDLRDVVQLDGGESYLCGRTRSGGVRCRGAGAHGELGSGATGPNGLAAIIALRAANVAGIDDAKQIAAGRSHACAVRADGGVWCWGRDDFGQASGVASGLRMCARKVANR